MLYIGTSGYSYDDWVGPYYPAGLKKADWLSYYARDFRTTEINFSYYRIPSARTLAQMAAKTPDDFVFTIKASQELTHTREENAEAFAQYTAALAPLVEAGKLGCVLAQFPYSFHATPENRDYLLAFRERLGDLPLVIEFRNNQWLAPQTYELLRAHRMGFCCVDEPRLAGLIPPVAEATSDITYVRFHGRNAAKWWEHDQAFERYDYTYSEDELREWVPKIRALEAPSRATFVYANNHWQAQAITTAKQLRFLLDDT
ncbi:MAG: DUF72 domain-containing protein [Chloroflexi bacterium]|nr:DUF72 domain-containing protein [Chloroflexota bacterium]